MPVPSLRLPGTPLPNCPVNAVMPHIVLDHASTREDCLWFSHPNQRAGRLDRRCQTRWSPVGMKFQLICLFSTGAAGSAHLVSRLPTSIDAPLLAPLCIIIHPHMIFILFLPQPATIRSLVFPTLPSANSTAGGLPSTALHAYIASTIISLSNAMPTIWRFRLFRDQSNAIRAFPSRI